MKTRLTARDVNPARKTSLLYWRLNGPGRLAILVLAGAAALAGLYFLSQENYLLFHGIAEGFSIVIAFAIFAVAWNSRRFMDNNYLLFIGIAYLFVGGLDFLHTLAYRGMGVFPGYGTNLATQLWIAARYVEALSLVMAPLFIHRRLPTSLAFLGYSLVVVLLLASIFYWDIFPTAFIDGSGLTPFKIASEYFISALLLAAIWLLLRNRREFSPGVVRLMVASLGITIASEMSFTLYTDAYGIANVIGHLLKVVSFYFIYKALIETGLTRPYDLLFLDLKRGEEALQRTNIELEASNRELEAFSYSVSHDLRAPLRSMEGFSQALIEDYGDRLDDEARKYLRYIQESSELMAQLIDDLLKLSRITRDEIQMETVDLSDLARSIAAELGERGQERRVEFSIANGMFGRGDRRLLGIALENLLGNAWKFTEKTPSPRIEMGASREGDVLTYFVRDNGAGFDMRYVDKLFQPFQRLHKSTDFPGSGIGLATVQRIIRRHGGRVWAEGKAGHGATFYFTLE
jgi:signal transduction histidine kinase